MTETMTVELVSPTADEMVLQVEAGATCMRIAQAFHEPAGWRVQVPWTGQEQIEPTTVAAIGALNAAAHTSFSGRALEIIDHVVPSCESCGRARGERRLEFPGLVLLMCQLCEEAYLKRPMAVAS